MVSFNGESQTTISHTRLEAKPEQNSHRGLFFRPYLCSLSLPSRLSWISQIFWDHKLLGWQWYTYLGPADMTGQLSSVQKSVMVPYSMLIWLKKSTAEINKQNIFQSKRRRPNTQSASANCWHLVSPLHCLVQTVGQGTVQLSAAWLCYRSFPGAHSQRWLSIGVLSILAHVARADALHVHSCFRQLPGVD